MKRVRVPPSSNPPYAGFGTELEQLLLIALMSEAEGPITPALAEELLARFADEQASGGGKSPPSASAKRGRSGRRSRR